MNPLEILSKIVTYPQSVATGIAGYGGTGTLTGMIGRATGDEEILKAGLKGNLSPSQLGAYNNPVSEYNKNDPVADIFAKIGGTGADIFYDPLLALGGTGLVGKAAKGTKLEDVVRGASTFGKMEDATKLGKAGQYGRRYYQGLLATSDPLAAIGVATGIGAGENTVSKLTPAISRLLAKSGGDEVAAAEKILKGPATTFDAGEAVPQQLFNPDQIVDDGSLFATGISTNPPKLPIPEKKVAPDLQAGVAEQQSLLDLLANTSGGDTLFDFADISIPVNPPVSKRNLPVKWNPEPYAMPAPEGAVPLDVALQGLLGRAQQASAAGGQRPDAILRALLDANRSGKTGRFLNAEQKRVLQNFIENPDALGALMRSYGG